MRLSRPASLAALNYRPQAEKPRVWIAKLGGTQWDLAPDGKRVAVVTLGKFSGSAQAGA
jgi:hypothetical protein